ncbi:MAG: hypothetical protein H6810_02185 [Phycisphaeraceae bacterium]|nr:MAG: hypothetical protein H6810_02185 [Phycisphaeraceae bacterium]
MSHDAPQNDVSAQALRLVAPVVCWGGGAGLVAIAAASTRGVADAAALGMVSAGAAAAVAAGLLRAFKPRPLAGWALPLLMAQTVRTLLAPAIGLGVALLGDVDPFGFWLSLLAVAGAMLVGETITLSKMFGSARSGRNGEVAA